VTGAVTVEVFAADEQSDHRVDTVRWVRLAERVLESEGVVGDCELSVVYIDEDAMADLNQRFLGKDGPTDVLSFPIDDEPTESGRHPDSGGTGPGDPTEPDDLPTLLGDIYICPSVASRQAPDHAGTMDDELALLLVHGILHLLGLDHEDDDEAEAMEARERALLDRFHLPRTEGVDLPPLEPMPTRLPPRRTEGRNPERLRAEFDGLDLGDLTNLGDLPDVGRPTSDDPPPTDEGPR